jgi:hypothetical protein
MSWKWRTFGCGDGVAILQLGEADGRERGLLISGNRGNLAQKLRYGVPSAFGGDNDAGVEYRTYSVSPMQAGSRRRDGYR